MNGSRVRPRSQPLPLAFQLALDGILAGLSVPLAIFLRVGSDLTSPVVDTVQLAMPLFAVIAVATFAATGLYRRMWRYASIKELVAIVKAVVIATVVFTIFLFFITRLQAFPRSTPIIQGLLVIFALGATRLGPRLVAEGGFGFKPSAPASANTALIIGAGEDTSLFIQALRRSHSQPCVPVGILDPTGDDVGLMLRDVPVLGTCDDLRRVALELSARGRCPRFLVIAEPVARLGGNVLQGIIAEGEALGLEVRRVPSPTELHAADGRAVELRPIELTDLLGRPQTVLGRRALDNLIEGRRVLVTGAGGSIGAELSRQIAALRPMELILLDSCEFNLYEIDLTLAESYPSVKRVPLLCNIRERERVMQVFDQLKPELVFHAAALKHVPMVELNPCEGALTNAIGTRNVADAAFRSNVLAMVQVSTDKVVNPTSVMGATKRMAELYCHALDLKGRDSPDAPRFMTVRFGNVLGSSGSLIPLFERQLKRGGPLTVTHPDIKRYFMTMREAVELVLQASAHGIENKGNVGQIFVLDMGDPIKIMDIAKQMIKSAGKEPDRDIKIEIIGLRPGEKLYEELFDATETPLSASMPGVLRAAPKPVTLEKLQEVCASLLAASGANDSDRVRELLASVLIGYRPGSGVPVPDAEPVSLQRVRERRAAGGSGAVRAAQ